MINEVISIIINSDSLSDKDSVEKLYTLNTICEKNIDDYEIIIVNNENDENSADLITILNKLTNARLIELTSEVSSEKGFLIGLEISIGDYIILFNPETDPVNLVVDSIQTILKGSAKNYLIGRYKTGGPLSYVIRCFFYSIALWLSGVKISSKTTTFRVIPRPLLNGMLEMTSREMYLFARFQKIGFFPIYIDYLPERFHSKKLSHYFSNFISLLMSNSNKFLRTLSLIGFISSIISLLFALYAIVEKMINADVVQGWASTVFIISFLFSIQFILLAFFGEYFSRNILDMKEQKGDFITGEKISNTLIGSSRLNVISHSINPNNEK